MGAAAQEGVLGGQLQLVSRRATPVLEALELVPQELLSPFPRREGTAYSLLQLFVPWATSLVPWVRSWLSGHASTQKRHANGEMWRKLTIERGARWPKPWREQAERG